MFMFSLLLFPEVSATYSMSSSLFQYMLARVSGVGLNVAKKRNWALALSLNVSLVHD